MNYQDELKQRMDHAEFERQQNLIDNRCFEKKFDDMMFKDIATKMNGGVIPKRFKEGIGGA